MKACLCTLLLPALVTLSAEIPDSLSNGDWSSIRAAYEAGRHQFFKQEDGSHTARNPGLGWHMEFDANGFTATDGNWTWGLELQSAASSHSSSSSNHLYQTRDHITEWFINDQRGLEQGWIITQPTGPLKLKVRGSLQTMVSEQSITFGGQITYSGLKAWDAEGKPLRTWFAPTIEGFAVHYDDKDAVYPITIDPIAQNAYLKASNTGIGDRFGYSVAVSGDTVVVGATLEASNATGVNGNSSNNDAAGSGAAYVFVRNGGTWSQQAYLKASNTGIGDNFGYAVSVSGDTLVVGAPAEDSNATGVNGDGSNDGALESGAVYVFTRTGNTWTQQAYLKALNAEADDSFGSAVAISGQTIVIGARQEDSNALGINGDASNNSAMSAGAAYVFVRSGIKWSQQAYLKASNADAVDLFGISVSISGETAVVGAIYEDSDAIGVNGPEGNAGPGSSSGAAYVFVRSGKTWSQQAYLKASNPGQNDNFGRAVSVSGDTVVVGADQEDSSAAGVNGDGANNAITESGAAYVFVRTGTTWSPQAYLKASNPGMDDSFGQSVSASGDTVVVGASFEDSNATSINGDGSNNTASNAGAAYVFSRSGDTWSQQAYLKADNGGSGDRFGFSVAVADDLAVAGAYVEASNATGVNGNGADNGLASSGAAYIFTLGEELDSIAKSGTSAPGATNIAYGTPGFGALNPAGSYLLETALTGSGSTAGKNKAIFSSIAGPLDLAAQTGSVVSGLAGLPVGAKIKTLTSSLFNRNASAGLFQATVTGSGINSSNNRLLLLDNGVFIAPVIRTGIGILDLGGAQPSAFREVLQREGANDQIILNYSLKIGVSGITKANDTGLLILNHAGAISGSNVQEGNGSAPMPAFPLPEALGTVGRATTSSGGDVHFISKMIPNGGKPLDALFKTGGTDERHPPLQGETAGGAIAGEKYGVFKGITRIGALGVLRATLKPSPAATNEGVWNTGGTLLLRKGQDIGSGVKITKITRVWGINNGQLVAHVTLTGNKQALLLRKASDGSIQVLLRTGDPAVGIGVNKITLASLQAIDVDPVNGHYVVLGSLKGAPSTANQALWSGTTSLGDDVNEPFRRLPKLRLRKGDTYQTVSTPNDLIRSIALKPAVDASGVGGRGLAQIINSAGQILLTITGDRAVRETLRLTP